MSETVLFVLVLLAITVNSLTIVYLIQRKPAPGPRGLQGPMGLRGKVGPPGNTGLQGPRGLTGDSPPMPPAGKNGLDCHCPWCVANDPTNHPT